MCLKLHHYSELSCTLRYVIADVITIGWGEVSRLPLPAYSHIIPHFFTLVK